MYVNPNDFIPLKDTNFAERRRRVESNFNESLSSIVEREQTQKEEEQARIDYEKSIIAENFGFSKRKRDHRKAISERSVGLETGLKDLLCETFTRIFYKSLILDESFKLKFSHNIRSKGLEFFTESFKQGILDFNKFSNSKSYTVKEIYESCLENAELFYYAEPHKKELILNSILEETKDNAKKIAEKTKEKVAKVIKKEKEIAEENEDQIQEHLDMKYIVMKKDEPSLFKSILINANRTPLNEDGQSIEELNMDMSLAESIIEYSLLEMLNTTYLINLDAKSVQSLAFKFRFKP
jgi:hypothetical protein